MQKVVLHSIGCRTNQEELETMRMALCAEGFALVDDVASADIAIVNSCAVTAKTEQATHKMLAALKKNNAHLRIAFTGCMATLHENAPSPLAHVNWLIPNKNKNEIAKILKGDHSFQKNLESDSPALALVSGVMPLSQSDRTRWAIKIQEGCNNRCSYCIVPQLRGPSKSATHSDVVAAVHSAAQAGYKEIVLTGTHIGDYHTATIPDLAALVKEILAEPYDFRLRLSSLDPQELTDEIIDLIGTHPRMCAHVHVCIQHAHAEVLARMNRTGISSSALHKLLIAIRQKYPHVNIGADCIVGFCGETPQEFDYLCSFVKSVGFGYGHVFRYSVRPGTESQEMVDDVPASVSTLRSEKLREIFAETRLRFIASQALSRQVVIVEKGTEVVGLTANFLRVIVPVGSAQRNDSLDVILTDRCDDKGRIIGTVTKDVRQNGEML